LTSGLVEAAACRVLLSISRRTGAVKVSVWKGSIASNDAVRGAMFYTMLRVSPKISLRQIPESKLTAP
jgi:hypothetical protein